jgi:hypothetical protein
VERLGERWRTAANPSQPFPGPFLILLYNDHIESQPIHRTKCRLALPL